MVKKHLRANNSFNEIQVGEWTNSIKIRPLKQGHKILELSFQMLKPCGHLCEHVSRLNICCRCNSNNRRMWCSGCKDFVPK